jgi:hypothetical protein
MRTSYSSLAMIAVLRCEVLLVGGGGVRRSGGRAGGVVYALGAA